MKIGTFRFNPYFALAVAQGQCTKERGQLVRANHHGELRKLADRLSALLSRVHALALVAAVIGAGCASSKSDHDEAGKKKRKRQEAVLKLHLEINPDGTERVGTATVGRSAPFTIHVEKKAFLTELQIVKAELIDALGGYSIALQFDQKGAWILDQYSTANRGRRFAVWAEYGEIRWIAAPRITQRLSSGKIVFTPDVTREDAERIVDGLNYVAWKIQKGRK